MFVMQITIDDDSSNIPDNAFTPDCKLFDQLDTLTNGNVEHDASCRLANEQAYYIWSNDEEKLNKIFDAVDTTGFYTIISDDPNHLSMPVNIPSWSQVKAI